MGWIGSWTACVLVIEICEVNGALSTHLRAPRLPSINGKPCTAHCTDAPANATLSVHHFCVVEEVSRSKSFVLALVIVAVGCLSPCVSLTALDVKIMSSPRFCVCGAWWKTWTLPCIVLWGQGGGLQRQGTGHSSYLHDHLLCPALQL